MNRWIVPGLISILTVGILFSASLSPSSAQPQPPQTEQQPDTRLTLTPTATASPTRTATATSTATLTVSPTATLTATPQAGECSLKSIFLVQISADQIGMPPPSTERDFFVGGPIPATPRKGPFTLAKGESDSPDPPLDITQSVRRVAIAGDKNQDVRVAFDLRVRDNTAEEFQDRRLQTTMHCPGSDLMKRTWVIPMRQPGATGDLVTLMLKVTLDP
jgi:hypothetical protein